MQGNMRQIYRGLTEQAGCDALEYERDASRVHGFHADSPLLRLSPRELILTVSFMSAGRLSAAIL